MKQPGRILFDFPSGKFVVHHPCRDYYTMELIPSQLQSENSLKSSRISEDLLELAEAFTFPGTTSTVDTFVDDQTLILDETGNQVLVRITGTDTDSLLTELEPFGFELTGSEPELHFVEGFVSIPQLEALESLADEGLLGVIPIYEPITSIGSVTSQADSVLDANLVRTASPISYDGTGIEIGVLSDSYNNLGGEANDIASGDLPNDVDVLQDLGGGGIDEGRAMLQLIHDLAPGADLSFATAFTGVAGFANNIRALAANGADIIVDDIGYLTEPFFQDGAVSLAVNDVVADGVAYFSSAGNSSDVAYESTQVDFVPDPVVSGFSSYDFNPGAGVDTRQRITVPNGSQLRLSLQWDDPFFTSNGVDSDIDVYLLNPNGNVVARSIEDNIANQTPVEFLVFNNNTGQTNFDVLITLFDGPEPERLKYIPFGIGSNANSIYQEFATNSPTVFAHPAATGAMAVAAAPYFDPTTPEPFTSEGPTTILFDAEGNRLSTPEVRQTPDITAIDGTDTTFFGGDFEGNGFPNFFGTSAAAPHAAAVAALVLEANPDFTPDQLYQRLQSTATDIGEPGFDNVTGAGLINAFDAVFANTDPTSGPDNLVGSEGDDSINALGGNDTVSGLGGEDTLNGQGGSDILSGDDDNDVLRGGNQNDTITGGNGSDRVIGNNGNDILIGVDPDGDKGMGERDILSGNAGADTFVLGDSFNVYYDDNAGTVADSAAGQAIITDFVLNQDIIELSNIGSYQLQETNNGSTLIFETSDLILERIATVQGVTGLDVENSNQFQLV
jgi:Ca2+-binding RTX toxin-like protein